jgi:hypothetical protein
MQPSKFVVTSLSAGLLLFLLGGATYGWALADFFAANMGSATGVAKDPPEFWAIVVGELSNGTLLTLIIAGWAKAYGFGPGARVGAVMGLLMTIGFSFVMFGTEHTFNLTAVCVDVLVNTVRYTIVGGFVGWLASRGHL